VPKIRDHHTEQVVNELNITDYVDSSGIPAQVLAVVANAPELLPVLEELISEDGSVELVICSLAGYLPAGIAPPTTICFWEVMQYAAAKGDVVLGWTFPVQKPSRMAFDERMTKLFAHPTSVDWVMNPVDKAEVRAWDVEVDRLAVISVVSSA